MLDAPGNSGLVRLIAALLIVPICLVKFRVPSLLGAFRDLACLAETGCYTPPLAIARGPR